MITFEIRVSAPQIDLLRKYYNIMMTNSKEHAGIGFPNFVTHVRVLITEGLLVSYKDKTSPSGTKIVITRKGILTIKLIEEELRVLKLGSSILSREMADGRLTDNKEISHVWQFNKKELEAAKKADVEVQKRLKK